MRTARVAAATENAREMALLRYATAPGGRS